MVTLQWIYVSLRWERGDCIQLMVFLGSHVAQAARRWLRARRPGFDPRCRRGGDFLHSFVSRLLLESTQPTIKWVPKIKAAERRTIHPTFSYCHGCLYIGKCTLASTSPWAFMAYNGDIFYHGFLMWKCSACSYGFTTHRHWEQLCCYLRWFYYKVSI